MNKLSLIRRTAAALVMGLALFATMAAVAAPASKGKGSTGIHDIRVEGNERIEVATVLSYVDLQRGDPFDPPLLDRALKSLFATGLFADVSINQDGSDLVIHVVENPIINEIRFEGNDKLKSDDLKSELQLKPRQVLTRLKVQADVERLQEMYRLSGRFSAIIDPKIIKLDQNRVNLVFEIAEGPETLISRINFIGNKHFSDSDLQKVIRSREDRWYRFWTSDDKYDPDRMAYDQELLRKFYLEHGYADFRVDTSLAELTPDRKDFIITFSVEEGERYKIGKIDVKSNIPDLDPEPLKKLVTFESSDWYKLSQIENTVTKLTNELGNRQFAFVDVQPGVERNRQERTVDVTFTVNEGQKTFVENVNISGNTRTLDEVIRREMVLVEGDPFNTDRLKKSEQNIKDLGYFEKVDIKPQPGSDPNKTDIDIKVAEKSTGELSLGAGYSTSDGPLGDFSIRERNFLGKGQILGLSATIAAKRTEFDFSFTEPYFLKRDLSFGVDLFNVTRDLQDQSSFDMKRTGGGLRLGYPLSEKWRQSLNYRYEATDITNVADTASIYIKAQEGSYTTSALAQTVTYDTRNSKQDPTEGLLAHLKTEISGLGGESHYVKVDTGAIYYYPIVEKWIFSVLANTGYIKGWSDRDVRISERFYLGGDNLRGFADSGVGPRDTVNADALGGNQYYRASAELDFPTGLPDDLGLGAHAFTDVGSLWSLDDTGPTVQDQNSLRVAAGVGVSWKSPMGPVRINLAKPIKKEDFDETQVFRFSFGTKF